MEINIKIGKKELLIFFIVILVATGIGLGTWLGIKTWLASEPDTLDISVEDSEDLGTSRRISFQIVSFNNFISIVEINCDPLATFTASPSLPLNVSYTSLRTIELEGNFEKGVRYTFEFTIHVIVNGPEGEIVGQTIIETIKHRF